MWSVASVVVSEPELRLYFPTYRGEVQLPVHVPHDGVRELEGGDVLLGLLVRDHHQPTVHRAQLARLGLEVVPSSRFAENKKY